MLGANVNPGNSPGILTFAQDLIIDDNNFDLTNLMIEFAGIDERGVDYDAIDINGNLQLMSGLTITTSILSPLSEEDLLGKKFEILYVAGNILDDLGNIIEFSDFDDLPITLTQSNGGLEWFEKTIGWSLSLFLEERIKTSLTKVSEPSSIGVASLCLMIFGFSRYRKNAIKRKD